MFLIGVWICNDDNQSLRNVNGGGLPAKIFSKIMTKISQDMPEGREIAMITPNQFDTLIKYDKPTKKFQARSFDEIGSDKKNSSLIGGLIRALLWGQ